MASVAARCDLPAQPNLRWHGSGMPPGAASPVSPGIARLAGFFNLRQDEAAPQQSRRPQQTLSTELLDACGHADALDPRHAIGDLEASTAIFKAVVGPGLLFLPAAVKSAGIVSSMFLNCLSGLVSAWCMVLVSRTARFLRQKGQTVGALGDIGVAAYGKIGKLAVELAVITCQLGACANYCVFVAQNLQSLLYEAHGGYAGFVGEGPACSLPSWLGNHRLVSHLCLLVMFSLTPLTWVRQIRFFAVTNVLASVLIVITVLYMMFAFMFGIVVHGYAKDLNLFNAPGTMVYFGTLMYAYEGIGVVLPVERSMIAPQNYEHVVWRTLLGVMVQQMIFSVAAYLFYGEQTETILTVSLARGGLLGGLPAGLLAQSAWIVVVLCTFPLQLFPAARILEGWFLPERRSGKKWVKNSLRVCLVVLVMLVAELGFSHIGNFVAVIGAISSVPLAMIYPALFHYKICRTSVANGVAEQGDARTTNGNGNGHHPHTPRHAWSDIAIVVLGSTGVVVALVVALVDWITETPAVKTCIQRPSLRL